ncbi:MAG TPA: SusC/RagA family TonB-linked outer membrane protein [Longimicrobiaceae bacterium]|nr:SusC/RagA family TonB-linked outer membrane protein [Longimicrobiaceae bacterium]
MRTIRWLWMACLALTLAPASLLGQEPVTISGRVTREGGAGVATASVRIPALSVGVVTGEDGTYRLVVPGARVRAGQQVQLVASQVGLAQQSRTITLTPGASLTQNFQLAADPLQLEAIVVTGAGTETRAERLGTTRASVSGEEIARSAEPNVVQALAGRVANVQTTQQGGEAGAGTAIRIRGTTTISGTGQPLFVVDGMPVNNETRVAGNIITGAQSALAGGAVSNPMMAFNPDDIESIEILKGPAATSIYGAAAGAGGAILITTKRGRPGRTTYALRSSLQTDRPLNLVETQRTFGVGTQGKTPTTCVPGGQTNCFLSAGFFSWGPTIPEGTPTYDHIGELYETGRAWENSLSVSGGSERTTFYLSGSALNHDGFIVTDNDKYERYTVRLNGTHRMRDNFNVGGNFSYAQTDGSFIERGNSVNGLLLGAGRSPAEFNNKEYLHPVTGFHRSWRFPNPGPTAEVANRGFDNPFYAINEIKNLAQTYRTTGNVNLDWQALSWLGVRYNLGVDYTSDDRMSGYPKQVSGAESGGSLTRWQFYDRVLDHNLVVNADYSLGNNLAGTISLGQNLNESYFRQVYVTGRELIAPTPFKLANTVTRDAPNDLEQRGRLEGYFVQGTMDVADQLFLTAGIRNDGSSRFGPETNRAWYPRAQAAWSFSRTFGLPESLVSIGKARVAYGESGQQPAFYLQQDIVTGNNVVDFNPGSVLNPTLGGVGGLYSAANRGNPGIKPERVGELEAGLDLGLFNARSDISVTYYRQHGEDVILNVPTAHSTGFSGVALNAAEVENRGWEANLNVRAVETRDLTFNVGLQWARNRNELLSLGDTLVTVAGFFQAQSFGGRTTNAVVGHPLGVFRGQDFARCGQDTRQFVVDACKAANAPNGALYIAENGFPIRDPDVRVIGDPNPDWTGGLNAELGFRGLRLSALVETRQGGTVQNMTRASMYQYGTHKDTEIRGQQRTFGSDFFPGAVVGPGANKPVVLGENWFSGSGLGHIGGPAAQFQEDGSFTRLREVALAYTFDQPWVKRATGLSSIDARVAGRNLALWTEYTGFDPEVNVGGASVGNRGIDWWVNPTARTLVFSVGLNY